MNISKDLVLGIDPGFTGALALYSYMERQLFTLIDMPLTDPSILKIGRDHRHNVDSSKLAAWVQLYSPRIALASIERVHAAPEQGVTSTFRFGEGFGILQGIMAAFQIRTIYPHPSVWKIAQGVTSDKETSLIAARAHSTIQQSSQYFSRKKDHGRAEAFLLARFGADQLRIELLN